MVGITIIIFASNLLLTIEEFSRGSSIFENFFPCDCGCFSSTWGAFSFKKNWSNANNYWHFSGMLFDVSIFLLTELGDDSDGNPLVSFGPCGRNVYSIQKIWFYLFDFFFDDVCYHKL